MRILVTGGHGMLGRDLVPLLREAGHDVRTPAHAEVALEEKGALAAWLGDWAPERVYHLAAYTDVDGCEKDPERARLSNVVIDRGVRIPDGLVVGEDAEADARRFRRSQRGVCLITQPMLDRLR